MRNLALSYKLSVLSFKKIRNVLLLIFVAYSLQLTAYSSFADDVVSKPSSGDFYDGRYIQSTVGQVRRRGQTARAFDPG